MATKQNLPKLRFPTFNKEWHQKTCEKLFRNEKNKGVCNLPIFSVTINDGLQPRESLDRLIHNDSDKTTNLIVRKGNIAYNMMRMWQGAYGIAHQDCLVSPAYIVLSIKTIINSTFVEYLFERQRSIYLFWAYSYGLTSDRLRLYFNDFAKIKFNIPSLPEQQKIADFLSTVDQKIQALTRKKELLEQYKKGVMQKIFPAKGKQKPEIRFKRQDGSEYPEWEEKRIGQVLTIGSGKDYKHLSEGKIPVYGTGGYMLSVDDYLYNGDSVGIGRKGTIDKPVFLSGKFWTVDTLFYTHTFKTVSPFFIFLLFQNINWYKYNEASGVPSLSKTTIEKIKLFVPCKAEQIKISEIIRSIDSKNKSVSIQIYKMKQWKKGLLQKMFV